MFSELKSGLWGFGNPGLEYNVCTASDGVDFAVSAEKYHTTRQSPWGWPCWSPSFLWVLGVLGCPCLGLQFAVAWGLHGKEGRSGYLICQDKALLVQQLWQQGMGLIHTVPLPSSSPARTPSAVLWAHSSVHCSKANGKPESIQLNQKQKLLLLHDIVIGDTNWAALSFPSILCCIPGTSSLDVLQDELHQGREGKSRASRRWRRLYIIYGVKFLMQSFTDLATCECVCGFTDLLQCSSRSSSPCAASLEIVQVSVLCT